jgi:hypothetical protein
MKKSLCTLILACTIYQLSAQSTNCTPTLSQIYDFEVGDEFLYGIKENPGGGTQEYRYSTQIITILNKIISSDTVYYYREIKTPWDLVLDTLTITNDSSHFLNQCDSSIVKVNSLSYYKNYPAGVQDIYSFIRVYNNDTVRTWDNDHPRIVKAVGGFSHNNVFYTRSDSGTYEPIDNNFDGPHFLVEYAAGSGLLYEGHDDFESSYQRRLIHKINGTDTTVYHTASTKKSQLQPLEFSAFPNPVKNTINLEFKTSESRTYSITNSLGKIIMTGSSEGLSHTIDLTSFPKGIYFLNSTSEKQSGTTKFIKE